MGLQGLWNPPLAQMHAGSKDEICKLITNSEFQAIYKGQYPPIFGKTPIINGFFTACL